MERALSVDTSFLIDLERERSRNRKGPAHAFLEREAESVLCLSAVALGELSEGYDDENHPALWAMRGSLRLLPVDEDVAILYGRLARTLREVGSLIGTNDLWIAATSLRYGLPLLTADVDHFRRVPGLQVVRHR